MEKILFLESNVDEDSTNLDHVIEIVKNREAELSAMFIIPVLVETADWIETQQRQIRKAEEAANSMGRKVEAELKASGLSFRWKVVHLLPRAFMTALEELTPVDIVIAGDIDLEPLAEKGIRHLEDLSAHLNSPLLPLTSLLPEKEGLNRKVLIRLFGFGALSAVSYFVFFPHLDQLNHAVYMKGTILGALAVMLTVPVHAYIYGSFTETIPKLIGLEKSAGASTQLYKKG